MTYIKFLSAVFVLVFLPLAMALPSANIPLDPILSEFQTPTEAAQKILTLAQSLDQIRDPRGLFPNVYALTIQAALEKMQNGEFKNRAWVNLLILNYANLYRRIILQELTGGRKQLPLGWQLEFHYTDQRRTWTPELDLIYGIHVHIAHDLVETLLATPTDFQDPSIKADYLTITAALGTAMPKIWLAVIAHHRSVFIPSFLVRSITFQWISFLRRQAWDRAKSVSAHSVESQQRYLQDLDFSLSKKAKRYGILLPLVN